METERGSGTRGLFFVSGDCRLEVDGAEDIVSEDREGHLGFGSCEVPGQESSAGHHPLDGAESSSHADHRRRAHFRLGLVGALDTVAPLGFGAIERGIGVFEQRGKCLLGMQTH